MFSRKVKVEYPQGGKLVACPQKWLDSFAMRNFTNDPIFDDTLPVADGIIEIGARVPLDRLKEAMEEWFRRKTYIPKNTSLTVSEVR